MLHVPCWVCAESGMTVSVIYQSIIALSECGPIESYGLVFFDQREGLIRLAMT